MERLAPATSPRPRPGGPTCRGRSRLGARGRFSFSALEVPSILGILNVTPDSFSDGGRFIRPGAAVRKARSMARDGAQLIDVGGESTRPGATPVDEVSELRRVLPVIREIRDILPLSIDTTKARVAEQALEAGASIVNDVSGGLTDPGMLRVVAEHQAAVILMHRKGTPRTMQRHARYRDVVGEVRDFLAARIDAALAAGVKVEAIAVDPGIGFAKTLVHNLALLAHLGEIAELGAPVVIGVSRKSFLGRLVDQPADQRVEGTIAASLLAVAAGASVVRVHDVGPMARALRVACAVWGAGRS